MVVRDGAEIRRGRMQTLINLIESNGDNPNMSEKKIKAIFMLRTGLTSRKIDEYIEDLINAGLLERDGERLHYISPT